MFKFIGAWAHCHVLAFQAYAMGHGVGYAFHRWVAHIKKAKNE